MVSLHSERFVVVHLYSNFSVDHQNFPIGANLYRKLRFFVTFEAVGPHVKARIVKFGIRVQTWDSLPKPNFIKVA